jgi:hypothetical protein
LASEKKSFLLRIDPQLWAVLENLAASELRSVNGQIEYLLRDAVVKRGFRVNVEDGKEDSLPSHKSRRKN